MYICLKTKRSELIDRKYVHAEFYLNGEMYFSIKANCYKKLPISAVVKITTLEYILAENQSKRS